MFQYIDLGKQEFVSSVAIADNRTCALLKNGKIKCWGSDNYCQIGLGKGNIGTTHGQMGDNLGYIDLGPEKVIAIY